MSVLTRLRPATPQDEAVLRRWDAAPHLQAPLGGDPAGDGWDWPRELAEPGDWREMLIAEVEGAPIGFVQIMEPAVDPNAYWGDAPPNVRAIDIWIGEPDRIRCGYGTAIMERALTRCFGDGNVTAVLVDPLADNEPAHRFYEALGFRFVERRRFDGDDCHVYRLDRADWRAGDA